MLPQLLLPLLALGFSVNHCKGTVPPICLDASSKPKYKRRNLPLVGFFDMCGGGGLMTDGVKSNPFIRHIMGIDRDDTRRETYEAEHGPGSFMHRNILEIGSIDEILLDPGKYPVLWFQCCPCCRAFSLLNRLTKEERESAARESVNVILKTIDLAKQANAKYGIHVNITIENVPGMANYVLLDGSRVMDLIDEGFRSAGCFHSIEHDVYDCSMYGVASSRKRLMIAASSMPGLASDIHAIMKSFASDERIPLINCLLPFDEVWKLRGTRHDPWMDPAKQPAVFRNLKDGTCKGREKLLKVHELVGTLTASYGQNSGREGLIGYDKNRNYTDDIKKVKYMRRMLLEEVSMVQTGRPDYKVRIKRKTKHMVDEFAILGDGVPSMFAAHWANAVVEAVHLYFADDDVSESPSGSALDLPNSSADVDTTYTDDDTVDRAPIANVQEPQRWCHDARAALRRQKQEWLQQQGVIEFYPTSESEDDGAECDRPPAHLMGSVRECIECIDLTVDTLSEECEDDGVECVPQPPAPKRRRLSPLIASASAQTGPM